MISRIARVGRVARAGGGSPVFSPDQLTSLGAQYTSGPTWQFTDAPPGTVPVADTDLVRTWRDRTANAYHVTQATAGNRPTANLTSGVWRTTGNGTSTDLQNGVASVSNASGLSIAMAFLPTTSTGATRSFMRLRNLSVGDLLVMAKSAGDKFACLYNTSTGSKTVTSVASIVTAVPCSMVFTVDTGLACNARLNGVDNISTLGGAHLTRVCDLVELFSDGGSFWDGSIFEVIIRTVPMAAADITNIETYFRTTYGTP